MNVKAERERIIGFKLGPVKEIIYVTDLPVARNPLRIVELYGSRWAIENQGFRNLSQKWLIRQTAGRTEEAIQARISLVLQLYNALEIFQMKYGDDWLEIKKELEAGEEDLAKRIQLLSQRLRR